MMTAISVVICTYNRADLLAGALHSVCAQPVDSDQYEVIVVDNNSSDATQAVVARYAATYPNVRYCLEAKVGLSHARNRGWAEAKGEYVAYIDDDSQAPSTWLAVALDIITHVGPPAFGGPCQAFYLDPKPRWYQDSYASRDYGPVARYLSDGEFLIGCNMCFRQASIASVGGFDPRLGMTGSHIGYGEDNEIQMRIRSKQPCQAIYYDPRLTLSHLVRPEQMTMRWLLAAAVAKGRYRYWASQASDTAHSVPAPNIPFQAAKVLAVFTWECLRGLVRRDRRRYPYYHNYLYERAAWRLAGLGRLQAQWQHMTSSSTE